MFRADDLDGAEDDSPFEITLIDSLPEIMVGETEAKSLITNKLNLIRIFLTNARMIAIILSHVLFSQIKQLVQTRVIYDRELFNYEEYTSKCLNDDRLLSRILFATVGNTNTTPSNNSNKMPPGKYLMSEFFKFQKQDISMDSEM